MPLMKGAFVVFATPAAVPTDIIVFQFNSEMLTRRLEPPKENAANQGTTARGAEGAAHQSRAPTETLTVSIDLDASDKLEEGNAIATGVGLHPSLAQLELLLYPPSTLVILNKILALAGVASFDPPAVPLVLFVWGTTRLLPVKVNSIQITEQHFDDRLNPIVARAEISLTVLHEDDLKAPFKTLAIVLHVAKEGLSRIGTVDSALDVTSLLPF